MNSYVHLELSAFYSIAEGELEWMSPVTTWTEFVMMLYVNLGWEVVVDAWE